MTKSPSLRRQLSIGIAAGISFIWIIATVAAGLIIRHELDELFDSGLQETAQRILPLAVVDISNREGPISAQRSPTVGVHDEYLTYLVRDQSGNILLQSHDSDPATYLGEPVLGFRDTATHRIYGEAAVSGTIIVEVAEPLAHRREATFEATLAFVGPLLLLLPISLLGVWRLVWQSMRPVLAFRTEVEARGGGDLSPVSTDKLFSEIRPIGQAVNQLMDRLRKSLESERSFAANSAHELRTPIAASLAQTQRLIAEVPAGPLHDRAVRIEASLHHLASLSEKLLQLARAEGGGLLSESRQNLVLALEHLVEDFRQQPENHNRLSLTVPMSGAAMSRMDLDAFAILVRNIIENALKHGNPDEPIDISLSDDGVVRVVNAGPVVDAGSLAQLKSRFERGGTQAGGTGLGLAIADAIATGAGGSLLLLSPATDRQEGFEVVLQLPQ